MASGWVAGTFTLSINMSALDSAGVGIESSTFSRQHDTIEAGINNCLTKDGSNTPTADLDMGGNQHGNVGAVSSTDEYVDANSYIHKYPIFGTDGATGSASISVNPAFWPTSASVGSHVYVKMAASKPSASANTLILKIGASTYSLVDPDGNATFNPGSLLAGQVYEMVQQSAGKYQVVGNLHSPVYSANAIWKWTDASGTTHTSTSVVVGTSAFSYQVVGNRVHFQIRDAGVENKGTVKRFLTWSAFPLWISAPSQFVGYCPGQYIGSAAVTSAGPMPVRVSAQRVKVGRAPGGTTINPSVSAGGYIYVTDGYTGNFLLTTSAT